MGEDTIPFHSTVIFSCIDGNHFFDHDHDAASVNLTTYENGTYSHYLEDNFCVTEAGTYVRAYNMRR